MFPFEEKSGLNIPNRFNEHPAPQLASKEELKTTLSASPFALKACVIVQNQVPIRHGEVLRTVLEAAADSV